MSYGGPNERSPLLKSAAANTSLNAYSETNSSREEARPFGELPVTDNLEQNGSVLSNSSYQNPDLPSLRGPNVGGSSIQQNGTKSPKQKENIDIQRDGEDFNSEDTPTQNNGPMVVCRVCETNIPFTGKTNQQVVRCSQCHEVTPIRAAPPGKKYVRCPCNCLLVCKASSTRIACPRQNCRRVITLAASSPVGTAVRAPAGTCRVQCVHCAEVFMFNTLANAVAHCPHCKNSSSVGVRFARSRAALNFFFMFIFLLILVGLILAINYSKQSIGLFKYIILGLVSLAALFFFYRFIYYYMRLKISQVLGPI
ncbi:hypothetical protein ACQ4LE_003974 [Meloidogyne hapla]